MTLMEQVESHRFGNLAVVRAADGSFKIVQLGESGAGSVSALIEIEESGCPTLRISRVGPGERADSPSYAPAAGRVVLIRKRGDLASCYELSVSGTEEGIEIVLSGDHRCFSGRLRYRLFRWRAHCKVADGLLVVHGPLLADDPDS